LRRFASEVSFARRISLEPTAIPLARFSAPVNRGQRSQHDIPEALDFSTCAKSSIRDGVSGLKTSSSVGSVR
jgi:hypothetical protein